VAGNEYIEFSDFEVFGNEATWSATLVADEWQAMGLAPLNATGYGIVQDGLLQTYTWYIAEESLAQLAAVGVVEARAGATNAGDVDAAAAFFAEDAVYHLVPPPPGAQGTYSGQDEIRGRLAELASINGEMELDIRQVDADKVISLTKFSADALHSLGLPFVEGFEEYTIQDGKITAYTWTMTEGSLAWEQAAVARATNLEANKTLATRYLEELWNQGDLAVADETLSEDFVSHNFPAGDREALKQAVAGFREANPGAYFTLDDMVVTEDRAFIQNTMMTRPEDASESAEGEPGPPMLLVLGFEDAKITDRWLWLSPE
jgi:ketosteroid isomerase-like protein